jgi:hypothetical protein
MMTASCLGMFACYYNDKEIQKYEDEKKKYLQKYNKLAEYTAKHNSPTLCKIKSCDKEGKEKSTIYLDTGVNNFYNEFIKKDRNDIKIYNNTEKKYMVIGQPFYDYSYCNSKWLHFNKRNELYFKFYDKIDGNKIIKFKNFKN